MFCYLFEGIKMSGKSPYLVNLNPDPALSELIVYNLPEEGDVLVGGGEASYIKLLSFGIASHHATITVANGVITLIPQPEALSCINGEQIETERELKSGDRILWGSNHYFRLTIPGAKISTPANESVCGFEEARREVGIGIGKLEGGIPKSIQKMPILYEIFRLCYTNCRTEQKIRYKN